MSQASQLRSANPIKFVKEARVELGKVVWPSRAETIKLTGLVIAITVVVSIYIGGIDYILSQVLKLLVE
ncbi:preprotein translocase subunit SecE [Candidatus Roizmanbacteria bacterium CG22_combo_CG10-13_8_21_14_all_38_20]|uniref:Protein translocase subunit SecE n=1 Tax=Candidatus Roizmanbacteria bacterium CG22_combo_CG10-13_8_21_14_all_38_20 TaxID=1974862 RepID=A0A2H0BV88_9BACT|nr:preprotein translocase subunit SecE [Candidatus Microgenomates bacterium]PIP61459.1 MAG: preprotein translocase subunit SecE [Candidatus Roizmanbacteria bacterium CG22_combo_CG10-13_8_21_14_all_38_20]PJC30686.1 MAG: preprotein translocase subunit SecE [Candidatus Roizmanbacteria bacterium CG_4_9_14_0_2_um_filter_38_17]